MTLPRLVVIFTVAVALGSMAAVSLSGCHSASRPMHPVGAPGRWYVIEPGEHLADIARRAGVPEEDLLEVNGLHSASEVQPGKLIFVLDRPRAPPEEDPERHVPGLAPASPSGVPSTSPSASPSVEHKGGARFRWPVDAPRLTSLFGSRWGKPHEGIDLTAPIGTPVYAADAGEVVYAGNSVRGYGNMVVLKHAGDLMTVYAHNSVLLVRVGDLVSTSGNAWRCPVKAAMRPDHMCILRSGGARFHAIRYRSCPTCARGARNRDHVPR